MDLAQVIAYGLACALIGILIMAVPMRARILELRDERDAWRSRAHVAEGYIGDVDTADVNVIPQPPREHGLEIFWGPDRDPMKGETE